MSTVLAEVTRGELVESVHHGIVVVADVSGRLLAVAGDPETRCFFRSSAKPFQAVPLVESGAADAFGFTEEELALCCSSHDALAWQQELVAGMLAKLGLGADALQCGFTPPYDEQEAAKVTLGIEPKSPLKCDCSGKHTGMLATCLHRGWPIETYLQPDHPLQREILDVIAGALRMEPAEVTIAPDGCSVPTFGAPMRAFAVAYAALAEPERAPERFGGNHAVALDRLRRAMVAYPEHIAGPGELDTDLMQVSQGRIVAKLGAEGMVCLAVPGRGFGIAIRVLDGSQRAEGAIALAVLDQLGLLEPAETEELRTRQCAPVTNFNGWTVGEIRPAFALKTTVDRGVR